MKTGTDAKEKQMLASRYLAIGTHSPAVSCQKGSTEKIMGTEQISTGVKHWGNGGNSGNTNFWKKGLGAR